MKLAALPGIDIRGLAYDSRQVKPGDVFIALKGLKAAGADFAADAIRRGAVAVVADQPSDAASSGAMGDRPGCARGDGRTRGGVLRASQPIDAGRRHHRHERQDDNRVFITRRVRSGRKKVRASRHRHLLGRRRGAARRAHDTGGTGCAADVPADGRRGMPCVRHGSVVARARAAAGRRHGVRCGRVHEPDAGPSRLSRRHGVVLRREETAVRHASAWCAWRHQPRRSSRRNAAERRVPSR